MSGWQTTRAAAFMFAIALALALACACGSSAPPLSPPRPPQSRDVITPRTNLPNVVQPLLPRKGIYAAGGGLTSGSWRVVVDLENNTIYGGDNPTGNSQSFAATMPNEKRGKLSTSNETRLVELANEAWRAPPSPPTDPTADYDEILVVIDGDSAFYLQGFGPIREPVAAKLLLELRAIAGLGT